jgi:hypothetical protein
VITCSVVVGGLIVPVVEASVAVRGVVVVVVVVVDSSHAHCSSEP